MHIKTAKRLTALSIVINLYYQEDLLGSFFSVAENILISNDLKTSLSANKAAKMAAKPLKLKRLSSVMEKKNTDPFVLCYSLPLHLGF